MKRKELTPADLPANKDQVISKLWIYQRPRNERYEAGKQMRKVCPRSSHAKWEAPSNRPDPVDLIKESNKGRIPDLVPLRHGRMGKSPFTFYRGAALNMAYAGWCGEALALSHARSGDAAMLSGYMGNNDIFDIAISRFALEYANQNEKDYAVFKKAIVSGKLEASYEE